MHKRPKQAVVLGSILFLLVGIAPADAKTKGEKPGTTLPIKSGSWKVVTSKVSSLTPSDRAPKEETKCIVEQELRPLATFAKASDCRIGELESDAGRLSWKMICSRGKGSPLMKGLGDYRATDGGTRFEGSVRTEVIFQGKKIVTTVETKGVRLGECAPGPSGRPKGK